MSRQIRNVFAEGELEAESTMQKMHRANSGLVAKSAPAQKETLIKLIMTMLAPTPSAEQKQ